MDRFYSFYFLLFDFFENNRRTGINSTHPSPLIRVCACLMFIAGELRDKPIIQDQLPKLNFKYLPKINNPMYIYACVF